jgi:hypothetical protein
MSVAPRTQPTSLKDRLAKVTANHKYPTVNTQAWDNYLKPKQQQKPMTPAVDYLSKLKALSEQRKSNFTGQADEYAEKIGGLKDRTAERTRSLIPGMQAGFNTFKDNVMGQISAEEQATGEDIENVERTTGEGLRASAEANREQNANLQNIFAGLGTLDSGAFQDAQINQSNKFTRGQQTMQAQKVQEVNQLKRGLQTFRQQSVAAIQQEESNLQARLVEIENTIDSNSTEYDLAIKQAYDDAKNAVSAIDQEYAQAEYEVGMKEYELAQTADEKLSEGFLQTGQPQNRADYEWMVNNPDKYSQSFQLNQTNSAEKQDLIGLVDKALQTELGAYAGLGGRTGLTTYAGQGLVTKALIDQIKNKLTVEARAKLKGSGQISDKETEMLANSVSKLQPGMPLEALKKELQEIKNVLEGSNRYSDPNDMVTQLRSSGFSDQEIQEYLGA